MALEGQGEGGEPPGEGTQAPRALRGLEAPRPLPALRQGAALQERQDARGRQVHREADRPGPRVPGREGGKPQDPGRRVAGEHPAKHRRQPVGRRRNRRRTPAAERKIAPEALTRREPARPRGGSNPPRRARRGKTPEGPQLRTVQATHHEMQTLLLQLDGKIPNLALMRIATHHRARGDDVILRQAGNKPGDPAEAGRTAARQGLRVRDLHPHPSAGGGSPQYLAGGRHRGNRVGQPHKPQGRRHRRDRTRRLHGLPALDSIAGIQPAGMPPEVPVLCRPRQGGRDQGQAARSQKSGGETPGPGTSCCSTTTSSATRSGASGSTNSGTASSRCA